MQKSGIEHTTRRAEHISLLHRLTDSKRWAILIHTQQLPLSSNHFDIANSPPPHLPYVDLTQRAIFLVKPLINILLFIFNHKRCSVAILCQEISQAHFPIIRLDGSGYTPLQSLYKTKLLILSFYYSRNRVVPTTSDIASCHTTLPCSNSRTATIKCLWS